MGILGILGIVLISAIIVGAIQSMVKDEDETPVVVKIENFTQTKIIKEPLVSLYFAVDEQRQEIYCKSEEKTIRFNYTDLVAAEIKVNNDTVVSKKSASIGGALAGGLIAGGLGAVVGGTSMGKSVSATEVSAVNVHILLRNSTVDSFDVKCLPLPMKTSSNVYARFYNHAQAIFDILRLAMDKVQKTEAQTQVPKSNIEELKELAELKKQGVITDEEFATMKAKIINK